MCVQQYYYMCVCHLIPAEISQTSDHICHQMSASQERQLGASTTYKDIMERKRVHTKEDLRLQVGERLSNILEFNVISWDSTISN